jgi:hypothetical protein
VSKVHYFIEWEIWMSQCSDSLFCVWIKNIISVWSQEKGTSFHTWINVVFHWWFFFKKTRGFWSFLSPYLKRKLEKFLDSISCSSHCFPLWRNFVPWQQNKIQYNWFKRFFWKKSTQVAIFWGKKVWSHHIYTIHS